MLDNAIGRTIASTREGSNAHSERMRGAFANAGQPAHSHARMGVPGRHRRIASDMAWGKVDHGGRSGSAAWRPLRVRQSEPRGGDRMRSSMTTKRRKPSAVLFDFYNTLVRRVGFDAQVGITALLRLAERPSSISIDDVLARNSALEDRLSDVWDASDVWSTAQQFQRLLFDGLGVHFDVAPGEVERCFFKAAMAFERTEGIHRCLSGLRSRGLRLGVVSNHNCIGETLRSALSQLEIDDPFEFVVSSADYGIGKPNPLIFEAAVARLGVESSATWFVGDNLVNDIAGANKAGLFSVWYNPQRNESGHIEPDATIGNWAELEELIE